MTPTVVRRLVDWQDTDAAGHYHHSTVIRWVEAAEAELLNRAGLAWLTGRLPRVRYEVDYRQRLWFGDTAHLELVLSRLGTTSLRYDFELTRIPRPGRDPAPETASAAAGLVIAAFAPSPDQPAQPWPDDIAAILRAELVEQAQTPNPSPTAHPGLGENRKR
ncbi:acyl-CoA thioesterase [Nocardia beijingensis]|uniref:acyl-CoA thioesterase n=1 Tax=Nocardia beijingensis TaxID=95162 RepID=UPI0033C34580